MTAVALLGFFEGIAGTLLILASDHVSDRGVSIGLMLATGWGFVGTGLFAWVRRPDSRFGLLMSLVGLLWFLGALSGASSPLLVTLGVLLDSVYIGAAVHMLLAFPSGRLARRSERALVAATYLLTSVPVLVALLFRRFPAGIPRNLLFVSPHPSLAEAIERGTVGGLVALGVAVVAVLLRRWLRASAPERRLLAALLWSGVATGTLLVLMLTAELAGAPDRLLGAFNFGGIAVFASIPLAFLAGIVQSNVSRSASVALLMARLGQGSAPGPGGLRDALASALRDRSLALAYWVPAASRYVDAGGAPVALPLPGSGRSMTEVEHDGRRVAAILHDASLDDEPELVRAAGAAAALALENERLDAELRVQIAEVRASRSRLLEVVTRERRRIERDLHDGAQQRLVALALTLGIAEGQVSSDPDGARALIAEARNEARLALEELRELARGIHPAILTDRGLGPALEALASRAPLPVELDALPDERLPAPVEGAAYFVVAEALANVAKYADASFAHVAVARENGHAVVVVRDDGVGGADPAGGTGLRGLADRLAALDGHLAVRSEAGSGTTIRAEIPCPRG